MLLARRFYIDRLGIGAVGSGALFPNGVAVIFWFGTKEIEQFPSKDAIPIQINDYIVWVDK